MTCHLDETGENDLSSMFGLIITLETKTVEKKAMVITTELSDEAGLFSSDQPRERERERSFCFPSQGGAKPPFHALTMVTSLTVVTSLTMVTLLMISFFHA